MATIDYEHEYDTRAWAPGFEQAFARREAEASAYRAETQQAGRAELGLRYGSSERQFIDIFHPAEKAAGEPLAVFVHGGFWRAQSPVGYSGLARGLNAHGIAVAMIGYDLCPQVRLNDIVEQVRNAGLFLWRRNHKRMLAIGHSAGGHLCASLVATDWKAHAPDAPADLVPVGYAVSGVFELEPVLKISVNDDLHLTPEDAQRLSVILWPVAPGRVLDVVVGGAESSEFRRQSQAMAEAWRQSEAETRYEAVPGANHFTVIEPMADRDSAMTKRLVELSQRVAADTIG